MDWLHLTLAGWSVVTMLGGAVAMKLTQRQQAGQPKIVDPQNQRPLVDLVRDAVSQGIQAAFGPKDSPAPTPAMPTPLPAPTVPVDLNAIVQQLAGVVMHAMTQLAQQPPAPALPLTVTTPPKV
jgi:hypothetical protein